MASSRATLRRSLGSAAIVSPAEAARWLPFGDRVALRWLRARGLIRTVLLPDDSGTPREAEVVHWADVEEEIAGRRQLAAAPAPRKPLRRPSAGSLPWIDPEE